MKILNKNPNEQEAIYLMEELSKSLESITGSNGKNSFDYNDVCVPRSLFVIAYDEEGQPIGCGGIRPINDSIAEVKRMFAMRKGMGIGSEILSYLEKQAENLGYSAVHLETRLMNERAVAFYKKMGYHRISNYGEYVGNTKAICFEKKII